jgi:hypothetical protein
MAAGSLAAGSLDTGADAVVSVCSWLLESPSLVLVINDTKLLISLCQMI